MSAVAESVASDIGLIAGARIYARMTMMRLRRGRIFWAAGALLLSPLLFVIPLAYLYLRLGAGL